MTVEPLKKLIETEIDPPSENVQAPYIHGLLIAAVASSSLKNTFMDTTAIGPMRRARQARALLRRSSVRPSMPDHR